MKFNIIIIIFVLGIFSGCHASKGPIHTSYSEYSSKVEVPPKFFGSDVNQCAENEVFSRSWLRELSKSGRGKFFLRVVCSTEGYYYYVYGTKLVTDRYYIVVTRNNETAIYIFEYGAA